MLLITTLLELMLTLISWLIWMVMFTGIVDLESINPMSMRGRCITLSMPTTQQNIVLEVQRVQQGGQVIQELLEQTVLEDLPPHHLVQVVLAKEADRVEEEV